MKIVISILTLTLLTACDRFVPPWTFAIVKTDRPVASATLKLCNRTVPLSFVGGQFKTSMRYAADCDGGVTVLFKEGPSVFCAVGYVSGGDASDWRFVIAGDQCESRVSYLRVRERIQGR
jgi:hypothetical protein